MAELHDAATTVGEFSIYYILGNYWTAPSPLGLMSVMKEVDDWIANWGVRDKLEPGTRKLMSLAVAKTRLKLD